MSSPSLTTRPHILPALINVTLPAPHPLPIPTSYVHVHNTFMYEHGENPAHTVPAVMEGHSLIQPLCSEANT